MWTTTDAKEKSLRQKANKYSESYMDEQENRTSPARSLALSLARHRPLSLCNSSSLLASIKDSYYTALFLSIRDYFSLLFLRCSASCSSTASPPSTIAIVFSRNLFSIRFMAFTIAVSPSNLFSSHCAHFSIEIKTKARNVECRCHWNCCKFQGTL